MSYVTLKDLDRDQTITVLQDETPPKLTGVGGWEEVERVRRKSATNWVAQPLKRLSIPLLFDGWRKKESVQAAVNVLGAMGAPVIGVKPPRIKVSGAALLIYTGYISGIEWVVEDLDWGDSKRDENGTLLRAPVTVSLLEYSSVDIATKRLKTREKKTRRIYTVKSGDTLLSIARRKLGDATLWKKIASLNNIRDPRSNKKLTPGKKLRLP